MFSELFQVEDREGQRSNEGCPLVISRYCPCRKRMTTVRSLLELITYLMKILLVGNGMDMIPEKRKELLLLSYYLPIIGNDFLIFYSGSLTIFNWSIYSHVRVSYLYVFVCGFWDSRIAQTLCRMLEMDREMVSPPYAPGCD